jgi:DNA invertase Pin-like site-specific DNA recombinase
MSKLIGYGRVSTADQDLEIQHEALEAAGCKIVLAEKISGTKRDGREKLDLALKLLEGGDTLVVLRLDRLARNTLDLLSIVKEIEAKGASLRVLQQEGVDLTTSTGKMFLQMLGAVAEFETNIRRERQIAGIERARRKSEKRANGMLKYAGRPATIDGDAIRKALAEGKRPVDVAREMRINRATVYRAIKRSST